MTELQVLLEQWQEAMRKRDRLQDVLADLQKLGPDVLEPNTLRDVEDALKRAEVEVDQLQVKVMTAPR